MSTLCVVVDCSAVRWGSVIETYGDSSYKALLSGIVSFVNAHLSLSADNVAALLAADSPLRSPLLTISDQSPENPDLSETALEKLQETLSVSASTVTSSGSSRFSSALAVAFCHINRLKRDFDNEGRILIISLGADFAGERNALMNIFFAAHKHDVSVDVANIGEASPVLHQACDITGGVHIDVKDPSKFVQQMLTHCLGFAAVRSNFIKSDSSLVDYRATCHCHGRPVSIGFVCSVCLSVKCQFSPICSVCNTVYKIETLRPRKRRKEE